MPFCWVAFYAVELHPREGYYLWTLGMIVVLVDEELGRRAHAAAVAPAAEQPLPASRCLRRAPD